MPRDGRLPRLNKAVKKRGRNSLERKNLEVAERGNGPKKERSRKVVHGVKKRENH